jgi:hypothetical protein
MHLLEVEPIQAKALQVPIERFAKVTTVGVVCPLSRTGTLPTVFLCNDKTLRVRDEGLSDQSYGDIEDRMNRRCR